MENGKIPTPSIFSAKKKEDPKLRGRKNSIRNSSTGNYIQLCRSSGIQLPPFRLLYFSFVVFLFPSFFPSFFLAFSTSASFSCFSHPLTLTTVQIVVEKRARTPNFQTSRNGVYPPLWPALSSRKLSA